MRRSGARRRAPVQNLPFEMHISPRREAVWAASGSAGA
jgi:hypothetical protein